MPLLGDIFGYFGAGSASKKAQEGYQNALQGVLSAAAGQTSGLEDARRAAISGVTTATGAGNEILGRTLEGVRGTLNPYLQGGETGTRTIEEFLARGGVPGFQFNMQDYFNDPAYKFQLAQGTEAINNAASAKGLLQSGNILKDLTQYGQGLASTYYTDAFKRAMDAYSTNRQSQLANVGVAQDLYGGGLKAADIMSGAQLGVGGQQAGNVIGAGYYGGNTMTNIQKFIADLNMRAAETAGNYAVGKGNVAAAGALARSNALAGMATGGAGLAQTLLQMYGIIPR